MWWRTRLWFSIRETPQEAYRRRIWFGCDYLDRLRRAAMARAIFWISFAYVFYVYFGYPLLLSLWRRIAANAVNKRACEPYVTIVIAAYNERDSIRTKIRNCLELDYP